MSDFSTLLERNAKFATEQFSGKLGILPAYSTIILACVDARVAPAHVLGLEPGDALVFRSAGARVTDDLALQLGILWEVFSRAAGDDFKPFTLAIVHHDHCGMERLADSEVNSALSRRLGVDPTLIEDLAIPDHRESILADIERLRQLSPVPKELIVSGYLYNVEDGLVRELVAPTSLG